MLLRHLNDNIVTAATAASNTAEWFFCRKFSFVSCPADRAISNILHLSKDAKDVLGMEEGDAQTRKKYLGKHFTIVTEYDEIICISDSMSELNCDADDSERKRIDFKQKLDTAINSKPLHRKDDILNLHEVATQEIRKYSRNYVRTT